MNAGSASAVEAGLRAALGIPVNAARVLVFGESSHWDTNWLQTSEEYFTQRIEPIFGHVLAALAADPGRVYCVESLFFLRLYWERHPAARPALRALLEGRQLRLLATSFTTPDTLLPHAETILRDFQLGHAWLKENGLPDTPGIAYFPDNFGHSPHLPSLMRAVGVSAVALTRIDGMYFIAADYRSRDQFPRPGSTAELLEKDLKSHDFVWRDDDGSEILCHWNAHTYFQGDMLAHKGIIRWAGKVYALPWRTRSHIAARIDAYVKQLEPFARTPYLFCPIGMDFNDPIVNLPALLHRYNREHFASTGTWVLLAGLDDYLRLIDCRREALPVLAADPNPYWMGFCATRPEVKQRPTRITRTLLLAEKLSALRPRHEGLEVALREAWHTLVLSNHHDFIPGTSPDRVWEAEQRPWLDAAEAAASRAFALAEAAAGPYFAPPSPPSPPSLPSPPAATPGPSRSRPHARIHLRRHGDEIHVETPTYALTLSTRRGGCLTSLTTDEGEFLRGPGFELVAFHDEGGLWRLGHEYAGGRFAEVDRSSRRRARVEVEERAGLLVCRITGTLDGLPTERILTCRLDRPFVQLRVSVVARPRRTLTCRFETALDPATLEMDTVGGVIERPRERIYSPTFWAVPSRLTLRDGLELHALFESPTAASLGPSGALEWIVARNAPKERAYGLLPVMAHPIGGTNEGRQIHEASLLPGRVGGDPAHLHTARRHLGAAWLPEAHRAAARAAAAMVHCNIPGVSVVAVKRAHGDDGVIVRLACERVPATPVSLTVEGAHVRRACTCDALERSLDPLPIDDEGRVVLSLTARSTSVHLVI